MDPQSLMGILRLASGLALLTLLLGAGTTPGAMHQLIGFGFGFEEGFGRAWTLGDGLILSEVGFGFRDAAGARGYHAAVSRYACQFANAAYAAPGDGIGLQVRRGGSGPDPTDEQISWVTGTTRFVITLKSPYRPADHGRIEALAAIAVRHAEAAIAAR
jgi:hypothetical protein